MNRRHFLALSGLGAPIWLGGCLGGKPATQNSDADPAESGDGNSLDENEPSEYGNYPDRFELVSLEATSERTGPEHRYTVETSHLYESVDDDHTVIEFDELSDDVQSVLAEARDDSYTADVPPDATRTIIEEYDFVDFMGEGGRYRYVGFEVLDVAIDTPPRLTVDATLQDAVAEPDDPAVIEIRAENTRDETVTWSTGAPPPFGILRANRLLLWTDTYEENGHVLVDDGEIRYVADIAVGTELEPGESTVEEYAIQPDRDGFGTGEFTVDGTLRCQFEGGRETVSYEVRWEIQKRDNGQ